MKKEIKEAFEKMEAAMPILKSIAAQDYDALWQGIDFENRARLAQIMIFGEWIGGILQSRGADPLSLRDQKEMNSIAMLIMNGELDCIIYEHH